MTTDSTAAALGRDPIDAAFALMELPTLAEELDRGTLANVGDDCLFNYCKMPPSRGTVPAVRRRST